MSAVEAPTQAQAGRLGPLSAGERLALQSVKLLDAEAYRRVEALRKQFVAAVEAEERAMAGRWTALLDAARERLGPFAVPPGHGVRETVDGDQTFLELALVAPQAPARG